MSPFNSPFGREPDDPWFRVGTIDVTSSLLVAGLCTISMFVYAIDKGLLDWIMLTSQGLGLGARYDGVRDGQVWRLVTWPAVNPPDIWALLSIVITWYLGKELERQLGRRRYLWFLGIVVLVPSLLYVLAVPTLIAPTASVIAGAGLLASAVVMAFVATYPNARSFFGVPFWVLAVVFEALSVLQLMGDAIWDVLFFLLVTLATALVAARSFGLSHLEWIPKVPLPSFLSGEPRGGRRPGRSKRGSKRGPATVTPIRSNTTPTPIDLLRQAEIDVLLDKINEHGIDSLTPEERRRLDEHSRYLRGEG